MAEEEILLPDIGDFDTVEIIDIPVKPGDQVEKEQSLLTLESDKATMDIPSPRAGEITQIKVKVGDKISTGTAIFTITTDESPENGETTDAPKEDKTADETAAPEPVTAAASEPEVETTETIKPGHSGDGRAHASPLVRRFARELGVAPEQVQGSARKGRVLKEDVKTFIKNRLAGAGATEADTPSAPFVDFSRFGETEKKPLGRIRRLTGQHLHQSWITIPHVTQFDEADITELETFRKSILDEAKAAEVKLTLLPFLLKAIVAALQKFPDFNASLATDGDHLILKKYYHIGVAVNTDRGLLVPVVRDADKKGLFDIAREISQLSGKARAGNIAPVDLQGGCFTVSNLGGVGGAHFTPVINAPEVAILGVSRAQTKPIYEDGEFRPHLIMPFSLSYDHRVVDGVAGAQFTRFLGTLLGDIRRHLLL